MHDRKIVVLYVRFCVSTPYSRRGSESDWYALGLIRCIIEVIARILGSEVPSSECFLKGNM